MIAEAIQADASRQADFRHSEVLKNGFILSGTSCPNCDYPSNAHEFGRILQDYADLNVKLHHATKPIWHRGEYVSRKTCATYIPGSLEIKDRWELEFWIAETRQKLKKIWPCESCILRYNPTLRLKHGPRLVPQLREDVFRV